MENDEPKIITIRKPMDNSSAKTYDELARLYNEIMVCNKGDKVLVNFINIDFIPANLLAVLGAIFNEAKCRKNILVGVINVADKIKRVMKKNGFGVHFGWQREIDKYNSCINFKIFNATTEKLEEFEKYLLAGIFLREGIGIPTMSEKLRNRIIDNFLEMFNNVIDHADTKHVYVCGQYFAKKGKLVFTIVDIGNTIKTNVENFLNERLENSLRWAIEKGNSTKSDSAPGGLGFSLVLELLKLNKGNFALVSANECYQYDVDKSRFITLDGYFDGTIVNVTFNLFDQSSYILAEERNSIVL